MTDRMPELSTKPNPVLRCSVICNSVAEAYRLPTQHSFNKFAYGINAATQTSGGGQQAN
jgi:hypothetical protein